MKKALSLSMALAMSAAMLAGCGGSASGSTSASGAASSADSAASGTPTVSFMIPDFTGHVLSNEHSDEVIAKYEAYTGTHVEWRTEANDTYSEKFGLTLMDKDNMPMILTATKTLDQNANAADAAKRGAFWDLTEYLQDSEAYPNLSQISPDVLKGLTVDGQIIGIPRARAIGAVNTVVNKNGLLYGYNTDYLGFAHLCEAHGVELAGKTVLILGTGGTHNTTRAVALDKGAAKVLTVSRTPDPEKGELSYAEAVRSGAQVVFNTTPAGMYPNVGVCSLDVAAMPGLEAVVDVVYNPNKTELILRAEDAGVPVAVGGLEMLVAQAVYAAEYFLGRKFEDAPGEVRRITAALRRETLNIALVGMPSCGKSTLGRLLAKQLGRPLVDLDEEIVKADGRSIPDLFAAEGEEGFRAKEAAQIARFGKEKGLVLSCGGGAVKRAENVRALRQNGVVLFIDRPVEALAVGGNRPLSSSAEALRTMEAQRRPLYLAAADAVISNTGTLAEALAAAQEALDEIFDS